MLCIFNYPLFIVIWDLLIVSIVKLLFSQQLFILFPFIQGYNSSVRPLEAHTCICFYLKQTVYLPVSYLQISVEFPVRLCSLWNWNWRVKYTRAYNVKYAHMEAVSRVSARFLWENINQMWKKDFAMFCFPPFGMTTQVYQNHWS